MASVAILDYGIGNLLSIARAIDAVEGTAELVTTPAAAKAADRLIVPGVGAYGRCADGLRERGLFEAVLEYVRLERPLLGICVGMQLMLEYSTEFGHNEGFGIIPGHVEAIPHEGAAGPHKIPHIGWSTLRHPEGAPTWDGGIFAGVNEGAEVYFIHSFTARPRRVENCLAMTDYNGCGIAAAVSEGPVTGVQFHPEKSGAVGLQILANFLRS